MNKKYQENFAPPVHIFKSWLARMNMKWRKFKRLSKEVIHCSLDRSNHTKASIIGHKDKLEMIPDLFFPNTYELIILV